MHEYVALARCGDRTCPECRTVDYYRLYNAYAPQIQKLGTHGLKLVTLTQKNRASLEGCVEDVREAWKKLRRRTPYKEAWKGGLYAVEAVNKGRGWHVHLYVLVEGGYVSQKLLAQDWKELTGDSFVVDTREVDAIYGLKYTLKYLKKAPTVSGYAAEYNKVLKGTRLVQAWGSWYGEVRAKEEDEAPKLVCAVCGHSEWIVIRRCFKPVDLLPSRSQGEPSTRVREAMITQVLHCPYCQGSDIVKHGLSPEGKQRYRCRTCLEGRGRTFLLE